MTDPLTLHFNDRARRFEAIYSGEGGVLQRTRDRLTRENVVWRFHATLAAAAMIEAARRLAVDAGVSEKVTNDPAAVRREQRVGRRSF